MKYIFLFLCCLSVSSYSFGYSLSADDDPEIAAAKRLMDYQQVGLNGIFAEAFTKKVSEIKVLEILKKFNADYGEFLNVRLKSDGKLEYRYEKALIPGTLILDANGKIEGLWFGVAKVLHDSFNSVLTDLKALGGNVAVTIRRNGAVTLLTYNNTVPLGVGSAFKMAILKTLVGRIKRGEAKWNDVIPLKKNLMSLPSGFLHTWQAGTPMTLASLANLMISQSDNTATDHLLFYCGRENVEKNVPVRDYPYLSTMELFKLKFGHTPADSALRVRYLAAPTLAEKRNILTDVDSATSDSIQSGAMPHDISTLEWFYTTDELCNMIESVRDEPAMHINSEIVDKNDWKSVAYKGGSEPGVINMNYELESKRSDDYYTVSVTANNEKEGYALDDFATIVGRFVELVTKMDHGEK